jgi:ADP-ribosylglycohydrolase/protein-tyrosine phosphatase
MLKLRTSDSDPILVDFVPLEGVGVSGRLGMTFAPGKRQLDRMEPWMRDLRKDLARLRTEYRTDVLVVLLEIEEMVQLGIRDLLPQTTAHNIETVWLPIPDGSAPSSPDLLVSVVTRLVALLRSGRTIVVHCKGGLGRTGLVCACCLVALGQTPAAAIDAVRRARYGTVETRSQELMVDRFFRIWATRTETAASSPEEDGTSSETARCRRIRGSLLGLALGDTLGAMADSLPLDENERPEARVRAPAAAENREKGAWTETTTLTLCAARAYEGADFDAEFAVDEMIRWARASGGRLDRLTARTLHLITSGTADWQNAGRLAMRSHPEAAGPAALVRSAPAGLVRAPDDPRLVLEALGLASLTYAHPKCLAACVAFATVLSRLTHQPSAALDGALELARDRAATIDAQAAATVDDVRRRSPSRHPRPTKSRHGQDGSVLHTLERALASLRDAQSFVPALVDVVNARWSGSVDAAAAAMLLGARFGTDGIPPDWVDDLQHLDQIDAVAKFLCRRAAMGREVEEG